MRELKHTQLSINQRVKENRLESVKIGYLPITDSLKTALGAFKRMFRGIDGCLGIYPPLKGGIYLYLPSVNRY